MEQNPIDYKYGEDVIIKTNAPKWLKEKMVAEAEKDEYIISKGIVEGKKSLKVMYLKSDSINFQHDSPQKEDFENIEDDLTEAQKIDAALKIGSLYALRDVFYLNIEYRESGIARLKDEEALEVAQIYLPNQSNKVLNWLEK